MKINVVCTFTKQFNKNHADISLTANSKTAIKFLVERAHWLL